MSMAMDMTVSNNRDTGVVSVKDKLAQQITRERSTRRRRTINVAIMRFALLAALLVPWQLGVEYGLINPLFFSSPLAISLKILASATASRRLSFQLLSAKAEITAIKMDRNSTA